MSTFSEEIRAAKRRELYRADLAIARAKIILERLQPAPEQKEKKG